MYRNLLNNDLLLRSRLLVHRHLLNIVQYLQALQHFPKNRILPIEMRRGRKGDEELTAVHVWALVRHTQYPAGIMP